MNGNISNSTKIIVKVCKKKQIELMKEFPDYPPTYKNGKTK